MDRTRIYFGIQCGITVCLLIFLLAVTLPNRTKEVDPDTCREKVCAADAAIPQMKTGNARDLRKNMGIDEANYDWVLYYCGKGLMDVSELMIVRTENAAAMEAAAQGAEARLQEQIINFTGYGTNQIDLLNHAVSRQVGDYYIFAISENVEKWEEVILDTIK